MEVDEVAGAGRWNARWSWLEMRLLVAVEKGKRKKRRKTNARNGGAYLCRRDLTKGRLNQLRGAKPFGGGAARERQHQMHF
jgi:hypothetical protein